MEPHSNPKTPSIAHCLYHNFQPFPRKSNLYTCTIMEVSQPNTPAPSPSNHQSNMTNSDVKVVRLLRTKNCPRVPKNLNLSFPNMEVLIVNDCKIPEITRDDLKGLKNLKDLIVEHTPVYHLDSLVFKDLRDLETIMFHKTKLSTIEPTILDHLENLKAVYLVQNPSINAFYIENLEFSLPESFGEATKAPTVEDLKMVIRGCSPCDSVCSDIRALLADDKYKDFTVTIKESCCHGIGCMEMCCNEILHVHKFLLIARSPILAQMILSSQDCRNLNLINIPRYAFKKVIDYFYSGIIPTSKSDPYLKMTDLFVVADKLGLKEVRLYARNEMLRQQVREISDEVIQASGSDENREGLVGTRSEVVEGSEKIKLADDSARTENLASQNPDLCSLEAENGNSDARNGGSEVQVDQKSNNLNIGIEINHFDQNPAQNCPQNSRKPQIIPTLDNLNYRTANQSYRSQIKSQISHESADLTDIGFFDFVKIELEDQYEIIGDFYDEVCSLDTE